MASQMSSKPSKRVIVARPMRRKSIPPSGHYPRTQPYNRVIASVTIDSKMETNSNRTLEEELLPRYTGKPLNAPAWEVYDALTRFGFKIGATSKSPNPGVYNTLRVTYRGIYVGIMTQAAWRQVPPWLILHRFPATSPRQSVARTPEGFDPETFAREHGVDPATLYLDYVKSENKHYLYTLTVGTTVKLMRDWARHIDGDVFSLDRNTSDSTLPGDIDEIQKSARTKERKQVLVDARMGQGKYRDELLREFGSTCAVTRLSLVSALRASHIVPWAKAEDDEKTDPINGLLLSANVDALFDRYLITFDPDGTLRQSALLDHHDLANLGPLGDLLAPPPARRAAYLRRHSEEFDKRERERAAIVARSANS
ncbi:HNH endonuclease signature motif containing protein [Paraburkholderia sp. A2RI-6]|uniref:HNH endonuclease n=1 Tax=Paraburkholderia sp. A2RI-6 TaxID=3028371 RepID=UPI003B77CE3B